MYKYNVILLNRQIFICNMQDCKYRNPIDIIGKHPSQYTSLGGLIIMKEKVVLAYSGGLDTTAI